MSLDAAELVIEARGARVVRRPGQLAAFLIGRPVAEVVELLPRLFNLCRAAQTQAARLALGLPDAGEATAAEVIRDHQAKVFVTLRQAFGLAPMVPVAFTPLPGDPAGLAGWIEGASPEAELARAVRDCFGPGVACLSAMAFPQGLEALSPKPFENSAAGRQAGHPVLRAVEAGQGRGPLWRYLGLLADAEAAAAGLLPGPVVIGNAAVVQAARGAYALRLHHAGGVLTGIERSTPTDQQLAPGGAVERALAALPPGQSHLAPLVLALHDPCIPVTLHEAGHA